MDHIHLFIAYIRIPLIAVFYIDEATMRSLNKPCFTLFLCYELVIIF